MNEKLFDSLMTYSKEQVLKAVSILLWFSLLFVTFNKFICKLNYQTITSGEKLSNYFLSGDYIVIISWLLCILFIYSIIKYLITTLIPSSAYGIRLFFKYLIPEEYKVSILNIYYKKAINAGKDHLQKAIEFEQKKGNNVINKLKIDLLIGIVLKFIIILGVVVNNLSGLELTISILTLLICIIILLLLVCTLTSISGRALLRNLISNAKDSEYI